MKKIRRIYPPSVKFFVVTDVINGKSLRKTSLEHDIPLSTVALWCGKYNVKSYHDPPVIRITNGELVLFIKNKGIVSVEDVAKRYGYGYQNALRRLRRLEAKGLVEHYKSIHRYYMVKKEKKRNGIVQRCEKPEQRIPERPEGAVFQASA